MNLGTEEIGDPEFIRTSTSHTLRYVKRHALFFPDFSSGVGASGRRPGSPPTPERRVRVCLGGSTSKCV